MNIFNAKTDEHITSIKELFIEYANSLNIDLSFQSFDKELKELPGEYTEPEGLLLLANYDNTLAGCVALRKIDDNTSELKRLYVRNEFRNKKLGVKLIEEVIKRARQIGYRYVRLDTLPSMEKAIQLYRSFGFREIKPYRYNPIEGTIYMELDLKNND